MSLTNAAKEASDNRLSLARVVLTAELDSMVAGTQWVATLILAEVGGIAGYRHLTKGASLGIGFGLAVLLVGLGLGVLVAVVVWTRHVRRAVVEGLFDAAAEVAECAVNPASADDERARALVDGVSTRLRRLVSRLSVLEMSGYGLFGLGSLWAVLMLFSSELIALWPW